MLKDTYMPISYLGLVKTMLRGLPERQAEVLSRRYGLLSSGEEETLEEIGEDFGITRERVRQLEAAAFAGLKRSPSFDEAKVATTQLQRHVRDHGDVRRETALLDDLAPSREHPAVFFLLDIAEGVNRHRENNERHTAWATDEEKVAEAEEFARGIVNRFDQEIKKPLSQAKFWEAVEDEAQARKFALTERARRSWVDISKLLGEGPLGLWGPTEWPDISPRGVKDRAYITLKAEGKPMHFTDIVGRMNRNLFGAEGKKAHVQTVHNELIKDPRFVLVGRGTYALADWGYAPGTVRDILIQALKESPRGLLRDELIAAVLKTRMVKVNTILLNLNDRKTFSRDDSGRYSFRKR